MVTVSVTFGLRPNFRARLSRDRFSEFLRLCHLGIAAGFGSPAAVFGLCVIFSRIRSQAAIALVTITF